MLKRQVNHIDVAPSYGNAMEKDRPLDGAIASGTVPPGMTPHRDQGEIDLATWWAFSQPIHTAPSAGDVTLLGKVLDATERLTRLGVDGQEAVVNSQRSPLPEPKLGILPEG